MWQVRALFRRTGYRLYRTERLANALGHLAGVLQQLSVLEGSQIKVRSQLLYQVFMGPSRTAAFRCCCLEQSPCG